jgi:hypothetical protein
MSFGLEASFRLSDPPGTGVHTGALYASVSVLRGRPRGVRRDPDMRMPAQFAVLPGRRDWELCERYRWRRPLRGFMRSTVFLRATMARESTAAAGLNRSLIRRTGTEGPSPSTRALLSGALKN